MASEGSTIPSPVVRQIDKQFLICSICLDRYENPKVLPCLHTFCERWVLFLFSVLILSVLDRDVCKQCVIYIRCCITVGDAGMIHFQYYSAVINVSIVSLTWEASLLLTWVCWCHPLWQPAFVSDTKDKLWTVSACASLLLWLLLEALKLSDWTI